MYRAVLKYALILAVAAPLAAQTTPAPAQTTPAPAAPASPARPQLTPRPPRPAQAPRRSVQAYTLARGSFLGVEPRDLTAERVSALKLKSDKGVEIVSVDRDSPAGKAGLKEQDVILTFNGKPVEDSEALRKLIRETPAGKPVALGISRDGQPMTLNATLEDRGRFMAEMLPRVMVTPRVSVAPRFPVMPQLPDMSFMVQSMVGRNGIMVEALTTQLGEYFGVKNGEGVLVRSVEKGSPGEAAGLKAGDVITRVGSDKVADTGDWRNAIRSHQGQTVQLGIMRDKRDVTLSLAIPARRESGSNFDWNFDVDALNQELERIGPEVERANQMAMAEMERAMAQHRADFEKAKQFRMEELQKELQSHQHEMERAREEATTEMQRWMKEHQKEMENLQREMEKMRKDLQKQFPKDKQLED